MRKVLSILLLLLILTGMLWWIAYEVSGLPVGNYFPETEDEVSEYVSRP